MNNNDAPKSPLKLDKKVLAAAQRRAQLLKAEHSSRRTLPWTGALGVALVLCVAVLLGPSLIQQPVPLPQPEQGADYMLETEELAPSFAAPQSIVADEPVAESVTMPRPKVVPMSQMTAKRKSSEETKSVPLSQQLESLAQRLQRDPEGAERAYQQLRRWCPELPAKLSQALAQLEAGQYPSYCPSAAGP